MKRALIYHIIGTLTEDHIKMSLWSLSVQDQHQVWDSLIIYNASDIPNQVIKDKIIELYIGKQFKEITFKPLGIKNSKSVVADWEDQMIHIGSHDFYLNFKADFILPRHILSTMDRKALPGSEPWFINFYKLDGKEYVPDKLYKKATTARNVFSFTKLMNCGVYGMDSMLKGDFVLPQVPVGQLWDGVMHAYSDAARMMFKPELEDKNEWGYATPIQRMADYGCELIQNDQFFAIHKWHEVPQKNDHLKQMKGNRF